jgi:vacuolar iron transporter family protein
MEIHFSHRTAWLRAAVLGANDGIISTASLIMGVAASGVKIESVLGAGLAGLVAGSMAMAAGEYVSVSAQADTEHADLNRERQELKDNYDHELIELAAIYEQRGLEKVLAQQVALALMKHDALGAHARDELGLQASQASKPLQAAWVSAACFASGAGLPLALAWVASQIHTGLYLLPVVAIGSLLCLLALGGFAASVGGANRWRSAARVVFWGALAMLSTSTVGHFFGGAA